MSRKRDWRQDNKALVERGSLTFLVDPKMIRSLTRKPKQGERWEGLENFLWS